MDAEDRLVAMAEQSPDLALRLVQVRMMREHRRISVAQVAKHMRCSREMVYKVLGGTAFALGSDEQYFAWLDRIDHAIDGITQERGGIQASCGCSDAAVMEMTTLLDGHAISEVMKHA